MISAYCITQKQDGFSLQKVFESDELHSLDQASRLIPDGVYTTFRTFDKLKVLDLDGHFDRLEESARILGREIVLNREVLRRNLRELLKNFPGNEARVRIHVPLATNEFKEIVVYIFLENLVVPALQDYQEGVRVITVRMHRENPFAKSTDFIRTADEIRQNLPAGVNEAIMVDENGRMLEGLSSNFFAIKNGVVYTDDQHVLAGITRKQVIEIIQEFGIPIHWEGFPYSEINHLDEAFITSTSRGVLPVRQIDHQVVGKGTVGDITKLIMERYDIKVRFAARSV